jgi:hypothetical protein
VVDPDKHPVGVKNFNVSYFGPVDCVRDGQHLLVDLNKNLVTVAFPPYGLTSSVVQVPFNFNRIACPGATGGTTALHPGEAVAGELWLQIFGSDWCDFPIIPSDRCVIAITPGSPIQGCPVGLSAFRRVDAGDDRQWGCQRRRACR